MTVSVDVLFCRSLLRIVFADVQKHFPDMKARDAWVIKTSFRDHWEFHGPKSFCWDGRAANAFDARAKGWRAWLRSKGVDA